MWILINLLLYYLLQFDAFANFVHQWSKPSPFIAKSSQHAISFFKLLRKEAAFKWTDEFETALTHKQASTQPAILSQPHQGNTLYLYLYASVEVVSAASFSTTSYSSTNSFTLPFGLPCSLTQQPYNVYFWHCP